MEIAKSPATRVARAPQKHKIGLIPNLLLALAFTLSACGPETPQPPKESPIIICPAPTTKNPNGIVMISMVRVKDKDGKAVVDMRAQLLAGTDQTKAMQDGGLKPFKDMERTGLDIDVPIGTMIDKSGKTLVIRTNLKNCLVDISEKKLLEQFIDGLNPGDVRPPDQQAYNGKPLRYSAEAKAKIQAKLNPQRGIRSY